jgi:O-antigen/teichoic acid export membrane protein
MSIELTELDYGCFYGVYSLICIITAFLDLGIVNAGTILCAEEKDKSHEIFSVIFFFEFIIGLISCGIVFFCSGVIAKYYLAGYGVQLLKIFAFGLWGISLNGAFVAYFMGYKYFKVCCLFRCLISLGSLGGLIACGKNLSLDNAAFAFTLSYFFFIPIQLIWIHRDCGYWPSLKYINGTYKKILNLIGTLAFISFLQTLLFNMDSVMLTALKGAEATAVYNIALPITQLLLSVLVFSSVFLPMTAEMLQTGEFSRLQKYVNVFLFFALLGTPCVWLVCRAAGAFLITLFFDDKYVGQASQVLPWLMSGYFLFSFGSFVSQILISMRKLKILLIISILTVILNFILNNCLIRSASYIGAAIATCCAYLFFAIICCFVFYKRMRG